MDDFICGLCGKKCTDLNSLSYHLSIKHKGVTKQEYYDKYLKQNDDEGICPICGKQTKFLGLCGYKLCCSKECAGKVAASKRQAKELEKYGMFYSQTEEFNRKRKQHNLEKYGVENYSQTEEYKQKVKATCQKKYGVDYVTQSQEFIDKRHKTYANKTSEEMDDIALKRKETFLSKYGVDEYFKSQEFKEKAELTNIEKYGVSSYSQTEEFVEKYKLTSRAKYGVDFYTQTEEYKERRYNTQRKNNTFNTSKEEDECFKELLRHFSMVYRNYNCEKYPYNCDFYIKERDLFVECNFYWTHGGHWFNTNNEQDKQKSLEWANSESNFKHNAYNTWVKSDTKKRDTAKINNLNYVVLWNYNDFILWKSLGFPIGQDWKREYSWLPIRNLDNSLDWKTLDYRKNIVSMIVKRAQWYEFYKREINLWKNNPNNIRKNGGTLQSNLYYNRLNYTSKNPCELTNLEILRGLSISGKLRAYTTFDNTKFREFLDKYNIKSIYDPCAGWGERLVTCAALDIKYFGIDVNSAVIEGHKKIIDHYGLTDQNTVVNDSSKYVNKEGFDATFTCPPYWNTEIYTDKGAENLSYEDFLVWWKQVVQNSNTPVFAYQINQKYKNDMNKVIEACGYKFLEEINCPSKSSHFTRSKGGVNNKKEYESIEVFICDVDGDGNPG